MAGSQAPSKHGGTETIVKIPKIAVCLSVPKVKPHFVLFRLFFLFLTYIAYSLKTESYFKRSATSRRINYQLSVKHFVNYQLLVNFFGVYQLSVDPIQTSKKVTQMFMSQQSRIRTEDVVVSEAAIKCYHCANHAAMTATVLNTKYFFPIK